MSTQVNEDHETESGYSAATETMLERFAQVCGVGYRHRHGELQRRLSVADVENTDSLDLTEGLVTDPANVTAIIFDRERIPEKFEFNHDTMDTPATNTYDETYNEVPVTVFEFGDARSTYTTSFIEQIEEIYDVPLRNTPQQVLGSGESYTWPLRVNHSESDTYILLAPRIREDYDY